MRVTDRSKPETAVWEFEFDPHGSQFFETKKNLLN